MLETWTARALGCALVLSVGCAETNKSLGNLGQGNDETDGGSGGSVSGAGGEPDASAGGETSAGGSATGSGGRATGAGGRMTGSGGAPAAGGTHATGGSGGAITGGSGGASGAATGGSGGELVECATDCGLNNGRQKLTWGMDGGEVAYIDTSDIAPCDTRYYHRRTPGFASEPEKSCYSFMPVCYPALSPITFKDVYDAVDAPDVQAAFAQSGIVFGVDPRPYDGTVFMVRYGDAVIYAGDPCDAKPDCKPVPPAVAALEQVLKDLDAQELARGQCLATFPR